MVTICTINLARTDSGTKHCIMAGPHDVKLITQHCYVELTLHIHLLGINTWGVWRGDKFKRLLPVLSSNFLSKPTSIADTSDTTHNDLLNRSPRPSNFHRPWSSICADLWVILVSACWESAERSSLKAGLTRTSNLLQPVAPCDAALLPVQWTSSELKFISTLAQQVNFVFIDVHMNPHYWEDDAANDLRLCMRGVEGLQPQP